MTDPTAAPPGAANGVHTPESLLADVGGWEAAQRRQAAARGDQPAGEGTGTGGQPPEDGHAQWRDQNVLTIHDVLGLQPPAPLIHGNILFTGTTAWLLGHSGTGKSFIALDWALSIATGIPWLGRQTTQARVLYVAAEGVAGTGKRIKAWLHQHHLDPGGLNGHIEFLPGIDLSNAGSLGALQLQRAIETEHYGLLVLDTQARVTPGANENNKNEMDGFISALTRIAKTGCTVLTVHHSPKSGYDPFRGSGAIRGAADTAWLVERDDNDGPLREVRLANDKHKDVETLPPIHLEFYKSLDSLCVSNAACEEEVLGSRDRISPDVAARLRTYALAKIVEAGTIPVTKAEITGIVQREAAALKRDVHKTTVYKWLESLASDGLVEADGGRVGGTGGRSVTATDGGRALIGRLNRADADEDDDH